MLVASILITIRRKGFVISMMKLNTTTALGLLSVLLCFAVSQTGCDKNKVDMVRIKGKVTIDGAPVEQGAIKFYPEDGDTPGGGGGIQNGTYTANVPPGKKKVLITGFKVVGKEKLYDTPDSPTTDTLEPTVPAVYNSLYNSPLKADVTKETKELNFELDSKAKSN